MLLRLTCSVLFLLTPALAVAQPPQPGSQSPGLPHDRLMVYQDADGKLQPVRTVADWERRRAAILLGMQEAMGPLPERDPGAPLEMRIVDEIKGEGFRRDTLTFSAGDGDRIPADLYFPDPMPDGEKLPAILALHSTGAEGKRIVAGEGSRMNRQYAIELVKRGYIVIAPDYPSFGDYKGYDFAADKYVSGTMKGIINHMRCVDLLVSLPNVDPERIGVIGHSLGGHNSMFVGVFDPRIKVIVSSCGWTPFHDYYAGNIKGWTSDRYMPRLNDVYKLDPNLVPFDFYEVVAALAPRAFYSNSPISDSNFDVNGVKKAIPKAQEVYKLYGAEDKLQVRYPPCEHDFPTEIRLESYEFIDKALNHTPRQSVDFSGELPRIPPLEPDAALAKFDTAPGYVVQRTAAEPLVTDPVAMSFDADGNLYVAEMKDYSEQATEHLGQIRVLRDTNQDGVFDESTVFAAGLSWPTAILCFDGGVFVGAPPQIHYMKDTNGDFVADEKRVVFDGFGRSNVQGLMNCLRWGPDNRIHGAASSAGGTVVRVGEPNAAPVDLRGRDFSFDPRLLDLRAESGGAQHGLSFDDWGRKFVCSNSDHAQVVVFDDRYFARNSHLPAPSPRLSIADDGGQAPVFRSSPVEPWRIVRTRLRVSGVVPGAVEGGGRAAGYFTGATGITIYRGDAFPESDRGLAIVGDVGSNIVHRKRLIANDVAFTATRIDRDSELLRSSDVWFRPVQFSNAPDGCLHVLDMYRETIEHPASLPPMIKQHLDLTSGRDRGRLYRVAPEGYRYRPTPQLSQASGEDLVRLLEHDNSWHRETAARLLYERQDRDVVPQIREMVRTGTKPLGRFHALCVLPALDGLRAEDVAVALKDSQSEIRERALILAERFPDDPAVRKGVAALIGDEAVRVRFQAAFSLGEFPVAWRVPLLTELLTTDGGNRWIRLAALSSLAQGSLDVEQGLLASEQFRRQPFARTVLDDLTRLVARQTQRDDLLRFVGTLGATPGISPTLVRTVVAAVVATDSRTLPALMSGESGRLLTEMLTGARKTLADPMSAPAARVEAVETLLIARSEQDLPLLLGQLDPGQEESVRSAAMAALGRYSDPAIAVAVLAKWEQFTPGSRAAAEELLFSRPVWITAVLDQLDGGQRRLGEFTRARLDGLKSHADAGIRKRAVDLLSKAPVSSRAAVIEQYRPALSQSGDIDRGRALFRKECSVCHKLENVGHEIGPNLASIQNRGAEAIVTNVLDPNREVNPQYLSYVVALTDGRTQTGMIQAENASSVTLVRAENKTDTFLRSDIEAIRNSGLSLMPEGLEKQVSVEGLADLIAYLLSLR